MANQSTLALVLQQLQAELGQEISTANENVQRLYLLIEGVQNWLATETDWPFLAKHWDVSVGPGNRYIDLPTASEGVLAYNPSRPITVKNYYNSRWNNLDYGIGTEEYDTYDSDHFPGNRTDPIQRWQHWDLLQFEVWPIPTTAQTLRFYGQRILTSLRDTNGAFSPTSKLDLDDQLIMLFVCAELLARNENADAQLKLAKAQQRLKALKSNLLRRDQTLNFCGSSDSKPKNVSIIAVHG